MLRRAWFLKTVFIGVLILSFFTVKSNAAEGEDITISANTAWAAGEYTYRDITISNNATLTLQGDTATDTGVTINARTITIETGSSISAAGQGFPFEQGPGAGSNYSGYGSGGSYGGIGGNARYISGELGTSADAYGSTLNPISLGSGGGGVDNGGSGGGEILLNLSGDLAIAGSLSANGNLGSGSSRAGGGSGGSIKVVASTISGVGTISANGGNAGVDGGGGGGGRISLYYSTANSVSSENISVAGGTGYHPGVTGSIFTLNTTSLDLSVSADLSFSTDEGIDENGAITSDGEYTFNDLTVSGGATLTLEGDTVNNEGVKIIAENVSVEAGSYISADGKGYAGVSGPGAGNCDATQCSKGTGASHGGVGGVSRYWSIVPSVYDQVMNPSQLGSGGGGNFSGIIGGSGGGLIELVVSDELAIEGEISADGLTGPFDRGGGSGGAIKINTSTLSGAGIISANGGGVSGEGGGGGGGLVAIYYSTMTLPSNNISADAGVGWNSVSGGDGSVFYYNTTTGDVDIENSLTFFADQGINRDGTLRSDGVYYYNNLTISNSATVTVGSYWTDESDGRGVTINLDGDLTVEAGSKIIATGEGYTTDLGSGKGIWNGGLDSGSGGGYGGAGGASPSGSGGVTYGENQKYYPYFLGSSGGDTWGTPGGGAGGGAVAIRVLDDVIINGDVEVNGEQGGNGLSDYAGGGGSGGSLFLSGDEFSGSGNITANGGLCGVGTSSNAGGGGGGRVSISYFTSFGIDEGNVTSSGGLCDEGTAGSVGTVYIRKMDLPSADFDLINPNNNSTQYTNSLDVDLDPDDPDADSYYESSNGDLTPPFYAQGWHQVSEGKQLSGGEGTKTVRAWLKDNNQLISSAVGEASIVLDQTNPAIALDQASETTTGQIYSLSGTVSDALAGVDRLTVSGVSVQSLGYTSLDGESEITVNPDGTFEADVVLLNGSNDITLTATDRAGNEKTDSITVTYSEPAVTPTPTPTPGDTDTADDPDGSQDSTDDDTSESTTGGGSSLTEDGDVSDDVGPIDTDKIKDELGDDFHKDGDKLVFYIDNPTVYGRSEPFAIIKLRLDFDEFQTTANYNGDWQYTFSNISKGEHTLFIYEYTKDGELIKTTSYELTLADKPLSAGEASISFLSRWWWLLLLLLIVASYLYYRSRTKRAG